MSRTVISSGLGLGCGHYGYICWILGLFCCARDVGYFIVVGFILLLVPSALQVAIYLGIAGILTGHEVFRVRS